MNLANSSRSSVASDYSTSIPTEIAVRHKISSGCKLVWESLSDSEVSVRVIRNRGELARLLMGRGARWAKGQDAVAGLIADRIAEG